jgi:hypothetical protein
VETGVLHCPLPLTWRQLQRSAYLSDHSLLALGQCHYSFRNNSCTPLLCQGLCGQWEP